MAQSANYHCLVRNLRKNADLAARCRLMANRYDPENPSRDFPSAMETRDLLNDVARALDKFPSRQNDKG